MDISVPSRFACLKIEDDEFRPVQSKSKKKQDTKGTTKKVPVQQSQAGTSKKGANKKKVNSKGGKQEDKQWEEWKKLDDQLVNENFEQDLQCALLQSKLDFEKQKKANTGKTDESVDKKKKKGKTTMSLDQFLDNKPQNSVENKVDVDIDEKNFFEKLDESTKLELTKEQVEEGRRKRQNKDMEEIITISQFQDKLEQEKEKNKQLIKDLDESKKEIALVKKRNTTLCKLLSQGEMKDKAEILVELERIYREKEELTEEVAKLHKLLEKERSNKPNGYSAESSKHSKEKTAPNKIKKKH